MKEVMKLLEVCFTKEKKPFLILSGLTLLFLMMILIPSVMSNQEDVSYAPFRIIQVKGIVYDLCLCLFIFFFLHGKRIVRLGRNGAVRIMMLPTSPYTYFIAQLLFVFATLCLLVSMFSLSYILTYFFYASQNIIFENHFVYMLEVAPLSELFLPLSFSYLIMDILGMFTLSLIFCMFAAAVYSADLMGKLILSCMVLLIPGILIISYLLSGEILSSLPQSFLIIGLLLMDGLLLYIEFKWLRQRKVAG